MLITYYLAGLIALQTPPVQPKLTPVPLPPAITLGTAVQTVSLNADEAAQIALTKSPSILLAKATVRNDRGAYQVAQSALLPSLSVSSSASDSAVTAGSGSNSTTVSGSGTGTGGTGSGSTSTASAVSSNGFSNSATLRQLIFDFNRSLNTAREALATERAANHSLTRAEQTLVFTVKQDYYTYVLDLGLVKVQEANLANDQALLDQAKAQYNAGPGEPSDLLSAQTAVAAAVQQLVQARNTALVAEINLAAAMGIDPRTPITPSTTNEPSITDAFADLYQKALQTRPDLLASIQLLRASGFQVAASRVANLPSLSVVAGYGARGPDQPFPNQSASIGLNVAWSIFDSGLTQGQIMEAEASRQTAEANLITNQINIGSQVASAWSTLQFAQQQIPVTMDEEKDAAESLRIAQGRWQAGVGTFVDVTTAQTALVTAQQAVVNAQSNLNTAIASLRYAVGL